MFTLSMRIKRCQYVVAYTEYGTKSQQLCNIELYRHSIPSRKSGDDGLAILNQALKGGFQDDQTMASN